MNSIPWAAIVQLVMLPTLLAMGVSAFLGYLLAFASDRPMRIGLLIGALLPFVGPLAWGFRARRAGSFAGRAAPTLDRRLRWALGVAMALSGLAFFIATDLPWAGWEGNVKGYAALGEATPLESGAGAVVLGLCGLVLVGCAISFIWQSPWGVSALVVALSGLWLAMTIDTLILFSAANHLALSVARLSDGFAEGHVSAGSGIWTILGASAVAMAAGLVLGVSVSRSNAFSQFAAADLSMVSADFDYGDGF